MRCIYSEDISSFFTFLTLIGINFCQILFVVGAYISPGLSGKTTECGILGISIHYFFLAQFTTIFAQV